MTKVPGNIQVELAMLWRTLNIIESVEGLSIVDFYEKYIPTIKAMPAMSLSAYWEEVSKMIEMNKSTENVKRKSLVSGKLFINGENITAQHSIMNVPELDYLRHQDRVDLKHDPLNVVQNIYGAAASIILESSPYNRSILLSACMALAVKSGRASLMLHFISIVSSLIATNSEEELYIGIDLDPLKDVCVRLVEAAEQLPADESALLAKQRSCPGQTTEPTIPPSSVSVLPPRFTSTTSSSEKTEHGRKGMVLSFGKADHGKLGHGDIQIHRLVPTVVEALQGMEVKKTASMSTYSMAVDTQGAVYVWGTGGSAGVAHSAKADYQPQLLEALPAHAKVVDVSCGLGHALFLLHTGRVFSWGNGGNGRLGLGDVQDRAEACPVLLLQHESISAVQCGASHSLALTASGRVYSWGKNSQGQCGQGVLDDQLKPEVIRKLEDKVIVQVSAGWEHSLALTREGRIYSWGSGYKDSRRGVIPPVLGLGSSEAKSSPELIASIETVRIVAIGCGWDHCLALDEKGKLLSWGSGQNGKLGLGTEDNVSIPCYIPTFGEEDDQVEEEGGIEGTKARKKGMVVVHMAAGCEHTAVLTTDGDVYSWGHGDGGRLGHGSNAQCFTPTKIASVGIMGIQPVRVHCGDKFTMLIANAPVHDQMATLAAPGPQQADVPLSSPVPTEGLFADVHEFLRANVPSNEAAGADKLNIQTVDSARVLRGMLFTMARCCIPSTAQASSDVAAAAMDCMDNLISDFAVWASSRQLSHPKKIGDSSPSVSTDMEALDREYAVECADSTFTNIYAVLGDLHGPFNDHLQRLTGGAGGGSATGQGPLSVMSVESSIEDFAKIDVDGASALAGHNNNASFNSTNIVEDFSQLEEYDAQRLVEIFESLYCLLLIFAANIEVFAQRLRTLRQSLRDDVKNAHQPRASAWRNLQRELGRVLVVALLEDTDNGSASARSAISSADHHEPILHDPDDEEMAADIDADAEYSLGSIESDERRLLQSIARQHHLHDYTHSHTDARQHRHQQDQQSEDDGNSHYYDDKSSYEGEGDHEFGADSGDDSFFSGSHGRRTNGSYDLLDDSMRTREQEELMANHTSSSAGLDEPDRARTATAMNYYSGPSPVLPGQASGRQSAELISQSLVDSSMLASGMDRERQDSVGGGSRQGSPALSYDSLGYRDDHEQSSFDRGDVYHSAGSSDDSDGSSRFDGVTKPSGQGGYRDDDDDMDQYYQEQAQEIEHMDLQRAIAASMQSTASVSQGNTFDFNGKLGGFGEGIGLAVPGSLPMIPRTRDIINSLASKCYLSLEAMGGTSDGVSVGLLSPIGRGTGSATPVNTTTVPGCDADPAMHSSAIPAVYLLWQAAQTVTAIGFDVLYTEEEQRIVLAQLIRSPAAFLYIFPGIVNGACDSDRILENLSALLPVGEGLFAATEERETNDLTSTEEKLDFECILAFFMFYNTYIRECRDVPISITSDNVHAADQLVVQMFGNISTAILQLTNEIISFLFNRIAQFRSDRTNTLNATPQQPLGPCMHRLFDLLVDCVQSDLEVMCKKLTVFDPQSKGRFQNSFLASVLKRTYSQLMDSFDVTKAGAFLPHSLRLLRLFQSNYDAYKRFPESSRDSFNAFLHTSFAWTVYHLSGTFSLVMSPPATILPKKFRPHLAVTRGLFDASDIRRHIESNRTAALAPVYSWQQQVWSAMGRVEVSIRTSIALSADTTASTLPQVTPAAAVENGVDLNLLLLTAVVSEQFLPMEALHQSGIFSECSVLGAQHDLQKFWSAGQLLSLQQKLRVGDIVPWQGYPVMVQLYLSLLSSWCAAAGLDLADLAAAVNKAVETAKTPEARQQVAFTATPAGTTQLSQFIALTLQCLALLTGILDGMHASPAYSNKSASLKHALERCKYIHFNAYKVSCPSVLPMSSVSDALRLPGRVATVQALTSILQFCLLPVREYVRDCVLQMDGNSAQLRCNLHLQEAVTVPPSPPATCTTSLQPIPAWVLLLLTPQLSVGEVMQQCLWEEDLVRNHQFALSLLIALMEGLQCCPEALRFCAASLRGFFDPIEDLEVASYTLQHTERVTAGTLSSTAPASTHSSILSVSHKLEQLLSKLDGQLTARVSSLPTARSEAVTNKTDFGKVSLGVVADLLDVFRQSVNIQVSCMSSDAVSTQSLHSVAPFSGSLKKIAEALGSSIGAPDAHHSGVLTLESVLNTNKCLSLLLSSLSGLLTIQQIEYTQRGLNIAKKPNSELRDRCGDKNAFLHALCGTLSPLSAATKQLVTGFQQHLQFCQGMHTQYLHPSVKAIEHCSPTILSSVFTPQGSFALGFWLYIPESVLTLQLSNSDRVERLHLLSRLHESGDTNLVQLLGTGLSDTVVSSLSVHLVIRAPSVTAAAAASDGHVSRENACYLEVDIAVFDYASTTREAMNTSNLAKVKAVRKVTATSKALRCGEWLSCVVELEQDSVAQPTTSAAATTGTAPQGRRPQRKTVYVDHTTVALFVQNQLHCSASVAGGRSALYQNMVIGKIPRQLGVPVGEKNQIVVADVFWVPSTVYLSTSTGYDKARSLLDKIGMSDLIITDAQASIDKTGYYRQLLPQCPPSLLLETLDSAFNCAARLLDVLSAHLSSSATTPVLQPVQGAVPRRTERPSDATIPLNLLPTVCAFATDMICLADMRAQNLAFKALGAVAQVLPVVTASTDATELDHGVVLSPSSPAGSAFNAAVQHKAVSAFKTALSCCHSLVQDALSTRRSAAIGVEPDLSLLIPSPTESSPTTMARDLWLRRLQFGRSAVDRTCRVLEWNSKIAADENVLLSGTALVLAAAIRRGVVDLDLQRECQGFAALVSGGGWAPAAYPGHTAEVIPRRLFLHSDARNLEQCAFPAVAFVEACGSNRPGVWLSHCEAAYQRTDRLVQCNPLLPRSLRNATLSTEMVAVLDPFLPLGVAAIAGTLQGFDLKSAAQLVDIMRNLVEVPTALPNPLPMIASATKKPVYAKSLLTQFENSLNSATNESSATTSTEKSLESEVLKAACAVADESYLQLTQQMSFLRCLVVQLTHLYKRNMQNKEKCTANSMEYAEEVQGLKTIIIHNLTKILSIAIQDPIQAVSGVFNTGSFKGVQMDVLKNLLKEGDIAFLEKISLRLWNHYRIDVNPSLENGYGTSSINTSVIQLSALAGEVVIVDTKIRALSHFPSVRLLGLGLERMSGRWFYECTLLTDGLIQIGWANSMFRCDPVCGQGVGDHTHSWAYDGLRCKKWNVSCEAYGRRWRLGDTVGTLIDMDLLEIRYYLNGEDLGQAFEEFAGYEIFPALSLNVRQSVRLNFGQYKFLHPPDELDGKAFRSIYQGIVEKQSALAAAVLKVPTTVPSSSSKVKSASSSPAAALTLRNVHSGENSASGERTHDAIVTVPNSPVLQRGGAREDSAAPSAPMASPLRQALANSTATPAGAETPSTHMDTPVRADRASAQGGAASTTTLPSVSEGQSGYNTPPRELTAEAGQTTELVPTVTATGAAEQNQDPHSTELRNWHAQVLERQQLQLRNAQGELGYDAREHLSDAGQENEEDQEDDLEGLLASGFGGDEDQEDEDDQDDEEEELDAEDEHRELTREDGDDDQDEEEEEVHNHLNELRRQSMIESLIGMGFPVEWALRAAEHCDVTTTESAAMAWIIERMELEQTKMEEMEGESSRQVEDEDFEEGEESALDYYMHRHAAAFRLRRQGSNGSNSAASGPAGGSSPPAPTSAFTHSQRLLALQRAVNPTDTAALSTAAGVITGLASGSGLSPDGSPTRDEFFGLRRIIGGTLGEDDAVSRSTAKSNASGKGATAARGLSGLGSSGVLDGQLYDDLAGSTPWNADVAAPPVLPGHYVAKHRHDQDKQEVLSQVIELEQVDMLPIIIACEFSLCVHYARTILLRAMAMLSAELTESESDTSHTAKGQQKVLQITDGSNSETTISLPVFSAMVLQCTAEPLLMCELFKICFRQHVVALVQPDRLFPLVSNGNTAGDARDRTPPFAPFASGSTVRFHQALSRLELRLFRSLEGSLAVEETSIQGLHTLSQMLDVAIFYAGQSRGSLSLTAALSSSSSISSNLCELQSQLLRNMGVSIDPDEAPQAEKFATSCKLSLLTLVRDALQCLQSAAVPKYDGLDWLTLSLDRHEKPIDTNSPDSFKADSSSLLLSQQESTPPVAYAYWLLRNILVKTNLYVSHKDSQSSNNIEENAPESPIPGINSPNRSTTPCPPIPSAFELLTSAETLALLMKLSATQNLSLRFCLYDLCGLILASVNVALSRARAAHTDNPSAELLQLTNMSSQFSAAEYYITIAKEKRLLQMFGARLKAEGTERRMFTRFTRSVGGFLFQWHLLRRQLGLSSLNYMHEYLMADMCLQGPVAVATLSPEDPVDAAVSAAEALTLSPQSEQRNARNNNKAVSEAAAQWSGLRITQLTSSSVTVDWRLDEKLFFPSSIASNEETQLKASAQCFPVVYGANLYFTAASHMGLETPVQVLANLEHSGTFHIEDLEADTLYKITIASDNPLDASSDQDDDGNSTGELQRAEAALKALEKQQHNSVGELSFFDNGAVIATPLRHLLHTPDDAIATAPAGTVQQPTLPQQTAQDNASNATQDSPLKTISPFPLLPDLKPTPENTQQEGVYTAASQPSPVAAAAGSNTSQLLVIDNEAENSTRAEVVVFIATEAEEPFQFEPDQTSPNITVTPHALTLHNTANKRWSTARASVRLMTGVHRWEVHIDRCVSKNIFLGVATKDARLDNYVGCDKHGWAFLANKAVWHNKSKVKTYGELFRTGDTVTVILDLDEGTLSYCINNKPLGVAMEGLTGPLFPAFSLYNEDDQITVAQVRTAVGDASSGAGSCAAEKILERIETLHALLAITTTTSSSDQLDQQGCVANNTDIPSTAMSIIVNSNTRALPGAQQLSRAVTEELGAELLLRWNLWKAEVSVRTVLVGSELVTICSSAAQCAMVSGDRLKLWENIALNSERGVVVGAGQHKLWIRFSATGEIQGFTMETINILFDKQELISIEAQLEKYIDPTEHNSYLNMITPILKSPTGENIQNISFFNFEISAVLMKEALQKLQSTWQSADDLILLDFLNTTANIHHCSIFNLHIQHIIQPSPASSLLEHLWLEYSEEEVALRVLLLLHLNDLTLPLLPLLCPYSNALETGPFFLSPLLMRTESGEAPCQHPTAMLKSARALLFPQVKRDFAHRLATCPAGARLAITRPPLSSNDPAASAGPTAVNDRAVFTTTAENSTKVADNTRSSFNEQRLGGRVLQSILTSLGEDTRKYLEPIDSSPSERLRGSPSPFFASEQQQLSFNSSTNTAPQNTASPTANSYYRSDSDFANGNTAMEGSESASGILGITSSSIPYVNYEELLVLEVSEETVLSQYIYDQATQEGVAQSLLFDGRWKLVSGIQCCYAGQLLSYFEQLATLNANLSVSENLARHMKFSRGALSAETLQLQYGGNAAAWEDFLRGRAESLMLLLNNDYLPPKQRSVPFVVRSMQWSSTVIEHNNETNEEMTLSKLFRWMKIAEHNSNLVSEWSLFAVFVEEACVQVMRVVDGLFLPAAGGGSSAERSLRLGVWAEDPAYLHLGLQLFHALGVLAGLALRFGAPIYLPLPEVIFGLLSHTAGETAADSGALEEDATQTLSLALRTGLVSTFPEPALDLLTTEEMRSLFYGGSGSGPPSAQLLQRWATYEAPVCADDLHVTMFWMAVCELAPFQIRSLLRALMTTGALTERGDSVLYGSKYAHTGEISLQTAHIALHILPPTAVALLSPDTSEILVFPDRCALALPRYTNLRVLTQQLLRLIEA